MKFSVIMPSYLGAYKGAAKDRNIKIIRAVESVLMQSFQDFELIVVADGCEKTRQIIDKYYTGHPKINLIQIGKQKLWSGSPRSEGIKNACGEWICYLDIDDYFGFDHLKILNENISQNDIDWGFFGDYLLNRDLKLIEQHVSIRHTIGHRWRAGTSNIVHRNITDLTWDRTGYDHDARFIDKLKRDHPNYMQLPNPEYYVCHVPGKLDV